MSELFFSRTLCPKMSELLKNSKTPKCQKSKFSCPKMSELWTKMSEIIKSLE